MMTIKDYKAFWKSEAILTPAEKMRKRMFAEFGAYTRTLAKNSMIDAQGGTDAKKLARRDRKISRAGFIISGGEKVSRPGAAAFSRLGWIKRYIFFAAGEKDVVIGPAKLTGLKSQNAVEVLEHGGTEQIFIGKKVRIAITAHYKARPTMGLAFAKAVDKKLPGLIENGIIREA